jgi:hypothetical protein
MDAHLLQVVETAEQLLPFPCEAAFAHRIVWKITRARLIALLRRKRSSMMKRWRERKTACRGVTFALPCRTGGPTPIVTRASKL